MAISNSVGGSMATVQSILLLGGTGRTGRRVLERLLARGVRVRAVVRSAGKLPAGAAHAPGLTTVEADLLSLSREQFAEHLRECDAVVSCLGHVISLRGIFGPPRDLVTQAVRRMCDAAVMLRPERPVRFVVMSSVSVHQPGNRDTRRGRREKALLWVLRALVPPAMDNQRAADFLRTGIGPAHPHVQWAVVRPDTLLEGDVSEYAVHPELVTSLFAPGRSTMANVAHFMCELVTSPAAWEAWQGKFPVVVDQHVPKEG